MSNAPENGALLALLNDLERSKREIRIKDLECTKRFGDKKPVENPFTKEDAFDIGEGHDTTTWISPRPTYTTDDGQEWSHDSALLHELLHAQGTMRGNRRDHDRLFYRDHQRLLEELRKLPPREKD